MRGFVVDGTSGNPSENRLLVSLENLLVAIEALTQHAGKTQKLKAIRFQLSSASEGRMSAAKPCYLETPSSFFLVMTCFLIGVLVYYPN